MTHENTRRTGAGYEAVAAEYLRSKGYRILKMNYSSRFGEIDIIAEDGNTLVYCEIKYRSGGGSGDPLEAVDIRKQIRICRAAMRHYAGYGYARSMPCRFDVIGIYGDGSVRHVENAFDFRDR